MRAPPWRLPGSSWCRCWCALPLALLYTYGGHLDLVAGRRCTAWPARRRACPGNRLKMAWPYRRGEHGTGIGALAFGGVGLPAWPLLASSPCSRRLDASASPWRRGHDRRHLLEIVLVFAPLSLVAWAGERSAAGHPRQVVQVYGWMTEPTLPTCSPGPGGAGHPERWWSVDRRKVAGWAGALWRSSWRCAAVVGAGLRDGAGRRSFRGCAMETPGKGGMPPITNRPGASRVRGVALRRRRLAVAYAIHRGHHAAGMLTGEHPPSFSPWPRSWASPVVFVVDSSRGLGAGWQWPATDAIYPWKRRGRVSAQLAAQRA